MTLKTAAVIPAAGIGTRMGNKGVPKQFLEIGGKEILRWTMEALAASPLVEGIVVVSAEPELDAIMTRYSDIPKFISAVAGGATRNRSVYNGVLAAEAETVLIHDAVRPCVSESLIARTILAALKHGAATAAVKAVDTLKKADGEFLGASMERENAVLVQTPQVFNRALLLDAFSDAENEGNRWTDETSMLTDRGIPVAWVQGDPANIKITTPEEFALASIILSA